MPTIKRVIEEEVDASQLGDLLRQARQDLPEHPMNFSEGDLVTPNLEHLKGLPIDPSSPILVVERVKSAGVFFGIYLAEGGGIGRTFFHSFQISGVAEAHKEVRRAKRAAKRRRNP